MVQPPVSSEEQHDDRDAAPCPPEDEECFDAPDAASMEEAISKFVEGLEAQERSGFDDIHRLLKGLPVPVTKAIRVMTHAQALEAQFLPNMTFARGKPRLGGLSVEQTFERQVAANEASKERAAENRRRRKADKA